LPRAMLDLDIFLSRGARTDWQDGQQRMAPARAI